MQHYCKKEYRYKIILYILSWKDSFKFHISKNYLQNFKHKLLKIINWNIISVFSFPIN